MKNSAMQVCRLPRAIRLLVLASIVIFVVSWSVVAQEQYGTVYLYRGVDTQDYGTQIVILNPEAVVYLDGGEFLSMPERTWVGFKMPVGLHALRMGKKRSTKMLDVRPNLTYYIRVTQMVYPNLTQFLSGADEKTGLEAIRTSYALQEKKIKIKTFEVIRKNPNSKKKQVLKPRAAGAE